MIKKYKIIIALIALILSTFFLISCNKENIKYLQTDFYVQDYNNHKDYILIDSSKKETQLDEISDVIKKSIFISKIGNKEIKGYNTKSYETKITNKDDTTILNYYFKLNEYKVEYSFNNKKFSISQKYLDNLNIEKITSDTTSNIIWFDTISNMKISDSTKVFNNMKLVSITKNSQSFNILQQAQELIKSTYSVDTLLDSSKYYINTKVVDTTTYNNFKESINDLSNSLYKNDKIQEKTTNLINELNTFNSKIVVGSNTSSDDFLIKFNKVYDDIKNLNTKLEEKISKYIILDSLNDNVNYDKTNIITTKNVEHEVQQILKRTRQLIVISEFSDNNDENTKLYKDMISFYNKYKNFEIPTVNGLKDIPVYNYSVEFYYENNNNEFEIDNSQTITKQASIGQNVKYMPEAKSGYTLSTKSTLLGVLKDDSLKLKVYYNLDKLIIPIDLDGGQNIQYNKNYIEVVKGQAIPSDVLSLLTQITKNADKYSSKYTFKNFVNKVSAEVIDITKPFENEITLKAIYTKAVENVNVQTHIYKEYSNTPSDDVIYPTKPEIVVGQLVEKGSQYTYSENIEEGFELDIEKSNLTAEKVSSDSVVSIYLKRKRLRVDMDLGNGILNDTRVVNNRATLKYGQKFDILLETIKVPQRNNKFVIFKEAHTDDLLPFDYNLPITKNLKLKIVYEEVDKQVAVKLYYSYLGKHDKNNNILQRTAYIKDNSAIKQEAFFMSDTIVEKAILDDQHGYIADMKNIQVNKDKLYQVTEGNQLDVDLKIVYSVNSTQIDNIITKDLYLKESPKNNYYELEGIIHASYNDELFSIKTKTGYVLLWKNRELTSQEIQDLSIGNNVKVVLPILKNYISYIDLKTEIVKFDVNRFAGLVGKIDNLSKISKISSTTIQTPTVDNIGLNSLYQNININNVLVLSQSLKPSIVNYYNNLTDKKYYEVKIQDEKSNIGYLLLKEDNINAKYFSELKKGDILNIKNAPLLLSRINRDGIASYFNSAYRGFPAIFIDDFNQQIEYVQFGEKITVKQIFTEYENFVSHNNIIKEFNFMTNQKISDIINVINDNNVYNGYKVGEIKVNNNVVDKNYILKSSDIVELIYTKADNYIEFYLYTLIDDQFKEKIEGFATTGGIEYNIKPVQVSGSVLKYILINNKLDPTIDINLNFGKLSNKGKYSIIIDQNGLKDKNILRYAAFDGGRYTNTTKYGNKDNIKISTTWAGQSPFYFEEGEKPLFIHLYSSERQTNEFSTYLQNTSRPIVVSYKGFVEKDKQERINGEHNVESEYARLGGQYFVRIPKNIDINNLKTDSNIELFVIAKYFEKELNLDSNNNPVERVLESVNDYKLHKTSITKLLEKDNDFNIFVVHVDANPHIDAKDDTSTIIDSLSYEKLANDYPNRLSINNDRVSTNKDSFFKYLIDHNLNIFDTNFGGLKSLQSISKLNVETTFNILDDNTFTNGSKTKVVNIKMFGEIPSSLFNINPNKTALIINHKTGLKASNDDFKSFDNLYLDENKIRAEYDIIFVDTQSVDILVYNTLNDNYTPDIKISNLDFVRINIDLPKTDNKLFEKYYYTLQSTKFDRLEITLPVYNVDYTNKELIIFLGSENIITIDKNTNTLLNIFSTDNIDNTMVVAKNKQTGIVSIYDNKIKLFDNLYAVVVEPKINDYIYISDNNLKEIRHSKYIMADTFNTNKLLISTANKDSNQLTKDQILNYASKDMLTITKYNIDNTKTVNRYNKKETIIDYSDTHNVIIGFRKDNGSYRTYDNNKINIDPNDSKLDIKEFEITKYKFGEYVKVYFDIDEKINADKLYNNLLDNYLLVKTGQKIQIPELKLKDTYNKVYIIKQYMLDNVAYQNISDIPELVDGSKNYNITIVLEKVEQYVRYKYQVLIQNPTTAENDYTIVSNMTKYYQVEKDTNIEYTITDSDNIIKGYKLNKQKSNLSGIASNSLVISLYLDLPQLTVDIDFDGGKISDSFTASQINYDSATTLASVKYPKGYKLVTSSLNRLFKSSLNYPVKGVEGQYLYKGILYTYLDENMDKHTLTLKNLDEMVVGSDISIKVIFEKIKTDTINYTIERIITKKDGSTINLDIETNQGIWDDKIDIREFEYDNILYVSDTKSDTNDFGNLSDNNKVFKAYYVVKKLNVTFNLHTSTWTNLNKNQTILYNEHIVLPAGGIQPNNVSDILGYEIDGKIYQYAQLRTYKVIKDININIVYKMSDITVNIYKDSLNGSFVLTETKTIQYKTGDEIIYNETIENYVLSPNYKKEKVIAAQGAEISIYYISNITN